MKASKREKLAFNFHFLYTLKKKLSGALNHEAKDGPNSSLSPRSQQIDSHTFIDHYNIYIYTYISHY